MFVQILVAMLKFIPIRAQAGISGFESPATEYAELELTLDQILIDHPAATYLAGRRHLPWRHSGRLPSRNRPHR
jgi:hypothetical protein